MNVPKMYCLVLDLGYPMGQQALESTLTVLENVLILSRFTKTQNKSLLININTVNNDAQNLGTIPMTDYKKIQNVLNNVKSMGKTNWRLSTEEYEDFLNLAMTQAINEYKLKVNRNAERSSERLQIAVLSGKTSATLRRALCSIRRRWANLKAEGAVAANVAADIAVIQVEVIQQKECFPTNVTITMRTK